MERIDTAAAQGDPTARRVLVRVVAALQMLRELDAAPIDDEPSLRRVRQSRTYQLWRTSHPYEDGVAVRIICWFPSADQVVVALVGANKALMGDVFYDSAAVRAEAAVNQWLYETENDR